MNRARVVRVGVALVVGLSTLLIQPPAAHAHATERSTSPEAGAILTTVPVEVAITFDSPIMDIGAALVVRDGSGTDATSAPPLLERTRIVVPLRPDSAPGDFSVAYRVVSEDGHAITSQYAFTVEGGPTPVASAATVASTSPASPTPTADPTPTATPTAAEPSGSTPPWILVLAGVGALGIALVAAAAVWKRRTAPGG